MVYGFCGRLVKCARVRSDLANDRFELKADLRPRRRYVRFTLNELTSSARRETFRNMETVAIGRYRFLRRVMN
jgi:hypothetical protein